MHCTICQSQDIILHYPATLKNRKTDYLITEGRVGEHEAIYQCRNCGLAFINHPAYIEQLTNSYNRSALDEDYLKEAKGRQKTNLKLIKEIQKFIPQGRLLDIGCNTGEFLLGAKAQEFEAYGLEPASQAVEAAKQCQLSNVKLGQLEDIKSLYQDNYFDVITLFDVIEHSSDPQQAINTIYKKLNVRGLLVVSTPDYSSFLSRLLKDKWHAILPHHIYYFSYNNLSMLLEQSGFEVVKQTSLTRHFSTAYLLDRLKTMYRILYLIAKGVTFILGIKHVVWPVNLRDQLVIFARKRLE